MAQMTPEQRAAFLAEARIAKLVTLYADGSPTAVPVWFEWDGRQARIFTGRTSEKVRRIRAEGVSVLLVEQLAALALDVADRGYVLDRGRVVAAGAARDLAADPRVAAAYLGRRVV